MPTVEEDIDSIKQGLVKLFDAVMKVHANTTKGELATQLREIDLSVWELANMVEEGELDSSGNWSG